MNMCEPPLSHLYRERGERVEIDANRDARHHGAMDVKVTVALGARTVKIEDVSDARVRTAFQGAAKQVAAKLADVTCPTHKRGATDVRIHFDRTGAADLKYDSCCSVLGEKIGQALG
jgi:hypothetical protein